MRVPPYYGWSYQNPLLLLRRHMNLPGITSVKLQSQFSCFLNIVIVCYCWYRWAATSLNTLSLRLATSLSLSHVWTLFEHKWISKRFPPIYFNENNLFFFFFTFLFNGCYCCGANDSINHHLLLLPLQSVACTLLTSTRLSCYQCTRL